MANRNGMGPDNEGSMTGRGQGGFPRNNRGNSNYSDHEVTDA